MTLEQLCADIPCDLAEADDELTRYGRWATRRRGGGGTCGSAEGNYRPPRREEARDPNDSWISPFEAVAVQRALAQVPEIERTVLVVLYVPQRLPPAALLRIKRIPPSLSRLRHLVGLRMFDNLRRRVVHSAPMHTGCSAQAAFELA